MSTFDVAEYESFHNRLRTVRKQLKINQVEVAESLGIAQGVISKFESGDRKPTAEQIQAIEAFFAPYGVPAGWLTASNVEQVAAAVAETGDLVPRAWHEAAVAAARRQAYADVYDELGAEFLARCNKLLETALPPTPEVSKPAVAAAVAGVLEGQVTVEEAITEATIEPGMPEDWADTIVVPPHPSVAPLPPAPLPTAVEPIPTVAVPLVTQTEVVPTVVIPAVPAAIFAQPVQAAADEDPLAAIFGAPPVPQVVTTTVEQPTYEVPPVAPPVAIETLLGFAQPAAVEA